MKWWWKLFWRVCVVYLQRWYSLCLIFFCHSSIHSQKSEAFSFLSPFFQWKVRKNGKLSDSTFPPFTLSSLAAAASLVSFFYTFLIQFNSTIVVVMTKWQRRKEFLLFCFCCLLSLLGIVKIIIIMMRRDIFLCCRY